MTEYSYRISPRAEDDLEDIWLYTLHNWSIEQADRYYNSIVEAFGDLASGRKAGRVVEMRAGYFKHPVGAHLIFYRNDPDSVVIVRVLHQRMDVGRHL